MTKFDYKSFAENMSAQAKDMLPADISKEARSYIIKTIENFVILAGEALVNDKSLTLTAENQQAICQILAEWIYHKSIDLAHSEVPQENWEAILQKVAFTVFEIAKQAYIRDVSQEDMLASVERHVNKSFKEAIDRLLENNEITKEVKERALEESNIDKMTKECNNPKKENNKNFVFFIFIKHLLAHIIKMYPYRCLMILSIFIIFKLTSKEIAENFTFSTFEISFASLYSFGFLSNNPSISETITNKSASSFEATIDDNLSLSEKQTCSSSEGETASFWFIIGITLFSKSFDKVNLKERYFFLFAKSSSVRRICAVVMPYFSKPSCQIPISIG